jgi:hypothetical protein
LLFLNEQLRSYTLAMGALPKLDPALTAIVDVIEEEGHQVLHLPDGFQIGAKQLRLEQAGDTLRLSPLPIRRTVEQIEAWFRSMDELDAGEVIPGGRDQGAPEPKRIFEGIDD